MLYTKNRLFAKYGHECSICYTVDEFPMFIPSKKFYTNFCRKLIRMRMASEVNKRGNYYLKSQGAIAYEHFRHLNYLYMIHPFSDIRTIWEIVMIVVYLYSFFTIPLDLINYELSTMVYFRNNFSWKAHRTFGDFLGLFDCVLNFITGYYDIKKREVIMEPRKVIKNYMRTYFFFDLISSLPSHLYIQNEGKDGKDPLVCVVLHYLSILKLVRYLTLRKFVKNLTETFDINYVVSRLFMVMVIMALYIHFVSCAFLYLFGLYFQQDENMIYIFRGQEKVLITDGYYGTLYMSILVVCNAGFVFLSDFYLLKVLVIFVWIASKVLTVYLIAKLIEVVMAQNSSRHKYVELVRQLNEYMRHKQLPENLQKRLLFYYEFRFQKNYFRESEMLNTISGQLRQEIVMHSCRKLVENVGFFRNLPLTLLVRIVSCLKQEIYLVNDVIVRANTQGDCMYFISTGTVAVYAKSGKEVCHLEDGDHFGEVALVMNNNIRVASVLAVEICELYMLERKDFIRVICPYPDLLNNVMHIAADRLERTTILNG